MTRIKHAALGLLALATLGAPARAAEVEPLLPAETTSVIFVNVRQILDSELIKKYALGQMKQALSGADAKKELEKLGVDPLKDFDRVTVGAWGDDPNNMQFLGVVHGSFNPSKLFAAAQDLTKKEPEKFGLVDADGVKLVKINPNPEKESSKPVYAAVASEKTVVFSLDKGTAAKASLAAEKPGKPAIKKDLGALILTMDEKASMYACGLVEKKIELPPNVNVPGLDGAELAKQLEGLKNMSMTLRLTQDVGVELGFGMKDTDSADDFAVTVNKLVGTARAFLPIIAGQQPNAKPLVDDITKSLNAKVKEKDVVLSLKVSAEGIGKASGAGGGDAKED